MKYLILLSGFILLMIHISFSQIRVSENNRFLTDQTGKPFFWLGDTDWELFHRLTREEALQLLDTRKKQGYNVLKAVALAEENGLRAPNRYGDLPLVNEDPALLAITPGNNPNLPAEYDYWDHVDFIMQEAADRGMYIGLLPTWGDKVAHLWGQGPIVFNAENAETYARILAKRYENNWNVLWILGGDRPAVYKSNRDGTEKEYDDRDIWRAMAKGIEAVLGKSAFIAYHPAGGERSTSQYIHTEPWLDINAFQSGHGSRETPAWDWVLRDLDLLPQKPTLDMEPCYEDHPVNPWDGKWTRQRGYFQAYDVRARVYRGVFAGACGVSYGHHQIWQFLDSSRYTPINIGDTLIGWQRAMHSEAAWQMQYLKNLMLSRPYFSRKMDLQMIKSNMGNTYLDKVVATRDDSGRYAMIYLPQNKAIEVDLSLLSGADKKAWWYDPRTGKAVKIGKVSGASGRFIPPSSGKDWVLVLDDARQKFPKPGKPL